MKKSQTKEQWNKNKTRFPHDTHTHNIYTHKKYGPFRRVSRGKLCGPTTIIHLVAPEESHKTAIRFFPCCSWLARHRTRLCPDPHHIIRTVALSRNSKCDAFCLAAIAASSSHLFSRISKTFGVQAHPQKKPASRTVRVIIGSCPYANCQHRSISQFSSRE